MTDHDRLTVLAWPAGKPPKPTAEDKAQAAAFVDAWFASDTTLCPKWKANNRADLIRSHAETVMGERMRAEQKSSRHDVTPGIGACNPTGEAGATNLPNHRRAA